MAYRIQRLATPDAVVVAISGDMDVEHAAALGELLANEADAGRVVFDLKDVTLVDRAAVCFLAGVQAAGIRIVNSPEYVRHWIAAEKPLQEPVEQDPHS